jgi:glucose-1-phosphate cytidylyltransferase
VTGVLSLAGHRLDTKPEIFDYMGDAEELVVEAFQRLVRARRLAAYEYDGFWISMDTFKDRQQLEDIHAQGHAPRAAWNGSLATPPALAAVGA